MVEAWYLDEANLGDQREDKRCEPNQPVDAHTLKRQAGVLYWKLDADNYKEEGMLDKICKERGYNYTDVIEISKDKLPNYEEKIKTFYEEHLHADEEIRFVLDGSGFFDVRDKNDRWIRIAVSKGDMLILPAGIYHRFTLDTKNYIKAMRLFIGDPIWTPINRPADNHVARAAYLKQLEQGFEELMCC